MKQVKFKLQGVQSFLDGVVKNEKEIEMSGVSYEIDSLPFDVPVRHTVYGTLLNDRAAYDQFLPHMKEKPYKEPPKHPILYMKPKNTWISTGTPIPLPEGEKELQMGASLGIGMGKTATKVTEQDALDYVLGYTIANDVTIPHDNFHRPAIKEKCRDGFLPIGPWIVSKESLSNPNQLTIQVTVNGKVKGEYTTNHFIRSVEKLIADVTDFMTLYKGDVLLLGFPANPPLAKSHDLVTVTIEGVGTLENRMIPENEIFKGGGNVS